MTRILPLLLLVFAVAAGWGVTVYTNLSYTKAGNDAIANIEKSEDLETYYNALDSYKQMIQREPDNIEWYTRLAEAYYGMEAYDDYVSECETIISTFPDDPDAYLKLMQYYADDDSAEDVISLYLSSPESIQANEDIAAIYADYEYAIRFKSSTYKSALNMHNGYALVDDDGSYGYVGEDASLVIECRYQQASPIIEENAAVCESGEWFIINPEGYRIAATHEDVTDLYSPCEGYAVGQVAGSYGFFSDDLLTMNQFGYDAATSMYNGVAAVQKDGKWALLDSSLNQITDFIFDDVAVDDSNVCSRNGIIFAQSDGAYAMYDTSGNRIGDETFEAAKAFAGSLAAVEQDGKWGYVDAEGVIQIEPQFEDASSFGAVDIAGVLSDGVWSIIDETGAVVATTEFDSIGTIASNGVVLVTNGDDYRYVQFIKYSIEA